MNKKVKISIISVALILGILLCNIPYSVINVDASISFYPKFSYKLSKDKTAIITSYNHVDSEVIIPETLDGYVVTGIAKNVFKNRDITKITLPDSLLEIGEYAFADNSKLTELIIPDSVINIGDYAFSSTGITNITLSENITKISDGLFRNCNQLQSVILSDDVTVIGEAAFKSCDLLQEINIPVNTTEIGIGAFSHCGKLTEITIPENVEKIGVEAFYCCKSLKDIYVDENNNSFSDSEGVLYNKDKTVLYIYPCGKSETTYTVNENTENINGAAFAYCENLENVFLGDKIKNIGFEAFLECNKLNDLVLPEKLKAIGDKAFYGCDNISEVKFNSALKSVGEHAFGYCSNLKNITINANIETFGKAPFIYSGISSVIFEEGVTELQAYIFCNCEKLQLIELPKSLTKISDGAFYGCINLEEINITSHVDEIGDNVFLGCYSLKEIIVDSDNVNYCSLDGVLYSNDMSELLVYPSAKKSDLYRVHDNTKIILSNAFHGCLDLFGIILPEGLETLDDSTFSVCDNLRTLEIPSTLINVGKYIFSNYGLFRCNVYYSGTEEKWNTLPESFRNEFKNSNLFFRIDIENSITLDDKYETSFDTINKGYWNLFNVEKSGYYIFEIGIDGNKYCEIDISDEQYSKLVDIDYTDSKYSFSTYLSHDKLYNLFIYIENNLETNASLSVTYIGENMEAYKGDADYDNKITAEDALLILKRASGIIEFSDSQFKNCDVNCDNKVNAEDALAILKYVARIITDFKEVSYEI